MINSEYNRELSFDSLTISITQINTLAADTAKRSINQLLTLRNWAIGYYIAEYEQGGNDRANYGDNLLELLEAKVNTKGLNVTLFRVCRQFYSVYPRLVRQCRANSSCPVLKNIRQCRMNS